MKAGTSKRPLVAVINDPETIDGILAGFWIASRGWRVLRRAGEISLRVEQAIAEGDMSKARLAAFRPRSG